INGAAPNRRMRFGLVPRSLGFFMSQGSTVGELGRSLRREVASATAGRGLFLTQSCLSRQVFYGSRRLAGGASHCQGSGASQTMQSTWEPQSGATLESDGMVKTCEHSQASSPRTSHTRLIKAWAKMASGQVRAL